MHQSRARHAQRIGEYGNGATLCVLSLLPTNIRARTHVIMPSPVIHCLLCGRRERIARSTMMMMYICIQRQFWHQKEVKQRIQIIIMKALTVTTMTCSTFAVRLSDNEHCRQIRYELAPNYTKCYFYLFQSSANNSSSCSSMFRHSMSEAQMESSVISTIFVRLVFEWYLLYLYASRSENTTTVNKTKESSSAWLQKKLWTENQIQFK